MLEKCANAGCSAKLQRLHEGRVFIREIEVDPTSDAKKHSRQLHYYWLCNSCCRTMTIISDRGKGIRVVPLPKSATNARAS